MLKCKLSLPLGQVSNHKVLNDRISQATYCEVSASLVSSTESDDDSDFTLFSMR